MTKQICDFHGAESQPTISSPDFGVLEKIRPRNPPAHLRLKRDGRPHRVSSDFWIVDDCVAVEAPRLTKDQQVAMRRLQRLQHQWPAAYTIQ